jgi:hypothetical protein
MLGKTFNKKKMILSKQQKGVLLSKIALISKEKSLVGKYNHCPLKISQAKMYPPKSIVYTRV